MPQMIVLPHPETCPDGAAFDAISGTLICDALEQNGIDLDHACEKSCACTTCHIVIREGFGSLESATEQEDDLLDRAWGLEPTSRLACQAKVGNDPLVIELPLYSINMVKEGH